MSPGPRMHEAYLAGRGLACALGTDLPSALAAWQHGNPTPALAAADLPWPLFQLATPPNEAPLPWLERARCAITRVAAECHAAEARTGPLFIASSSLDIGERETKHRFAADGDDALTFADTVAQWLHWQGPVYTVSTACTSAMNALHSAATLIRQGHAEHALVLGIELPNRYTVAGFAAMQLLSPTAAQPLGLERNGLVLGQAVAALRLSKRPSRWRLCAEANIVDGRDATGATASAVVQLCETVLRRAGITAHDISLIKPQAAGSRANDAIEAHALHQVLGNAAGASAAQPAWVSLKAAIGHTLGAAGAAELALLTACIDAHAQQRNQAHNTPQHPPCPPLSYTLDPTLAPTLGPHLSELTAPDIRHVLATLIGFGGGHSAALLERCAHPNHLATEHIDRIDGPDHPDHPGYSNRLKAAP